MAKHISSARKIAYFSGLTLIMFGFLFVLSGAFAFMNNASLFDDSPKIQSFLNSKPVKMIQGPRVNAVAGMILILAGNFFRKIGVRGLAGSGILLNPERARSDLEPYSRMVGGMFKDAFDQAGFTVGQDAPDKLVMLKCPQCRRLNEPDSQFCKKCGKNL